VTKVKGDEKINLNSLQYFLGSGNLKIEVLKILLAGLCSDNILMLALLCLKKGGCKISVVQVKLYKGVSKSRLPREPEIL